MANPIHVVVLGAGFGGLELATRIREAVADAARITLIDKAPGFVFGFSKLDVMFGKETPEAATHLYSDMVTPGINFVCAEVTAIDPTARVVQTSEGRFESDVLVVALGCGVDPAATPGLQEGGYEFYTNEGAFALQQTLSNFNGGRIVVGVTSTPFKCPPAPSETAILLHDYLTERGLRDRSEIAVVMPFGRPIPPSPEGSAAILTRFDQLGIEWHPDRLVRGVDAARGVVQLSEDEEMAYDLFLAIPKHVAPQVVLDAGMTVDGWIPVDPYTMATQYPDVYAVGDVTSAGTPKAGVFSEGQAIVAAEHIIARIRGGSSQAKYDGFGRCYIEFGNGDVTQIDITFPPGGAPFGTLIGPEPELEHDKNAFGSQRVMRWFGREWSPCGGS